MKRFAIGIFGLAVLLLSLGYSPAQGTEEGTWSVTQRGSILEIGYGSGTHYPQYAALHLNDSYFRLNYGGPTSGSGWGTSVILLPSFWSQGVYYQGAPITTTWKTVGPDLVLSIGGTVSNLRAHLEVRLFPPGESSISAQVTGYVEGNVPIDDRPGEAFKPVMLSSMHVSETLWDAQLAYIDCQSFPIPPWGWIVQPLVVDSIFGLKGGTSSWKQNAPTIQVILAQPLEITGWVTPSSNPNWDNMGFWAASDQIIRSWSYTITAAPFPSGCRLYLPLLIK